MNKLSENIYNPFEGDLFNRKVQIKRLFNLIKLNDESFVTCIDSKFGRGKTTFFNMFNNYILKENRKFQKNKNSKEILTPVYYDAWKNDYFDLPFISLISCLDKAIIEKDDIGESEIKTATGNIASKFIGMMTNGVVDLEDIKTQIEESSVKRGAINNYLEKLEIMNEIKEEFSKLGKGKKVFFIDELDRCKPTFALQLLEIIKHFFDIENYYFILAIDKEQLESTIKAKYGSSIDASAYLRRFIDFDIRLTPIDRPLYFEELINRKYETFEYEVILTTLKKMLNNNNISLRDIEKIVSYMKLILPDGDDIKLKGNIRHNPKPIFEQFLFAVLLFTKVIHHKYYSAIVSRNSRYNDIVEGYREFFRDLEYKIDVDVGYDLMNEFYKNAFNGFLKFMKFWLKQSIRLDSFDEDIFVLQGKNFKHPLKLELF